MADDRIFLDTFVVTTLVNKSDDPDTLLLGLDLPFPIVGCDIMCEGKPVTYSNNPKLVGKEVVAKVDYSSAHEKEVLSFCGNIGNQWAQVKDDTRYLKHAAITKIDKLSYSDEEGNFFRYDGEDANDIVPFCMFHDIIGNLSLFTGNGSFSR